MSTKTPVKLILPAILLVGLILTSLSRFTGTIYLRPGSNSVSSLPRNGDSLSGKYPDSIQQWKPLIEEAAAVHAMDPDFIAAVMLQESGGSAEVISASGAVGLMQIMPRDGIAAGFICDGKPCFASRPASADLLQPDFNIDYGTRMLAGLITKYGSAREALYHYGPFNVGYAYADAVLTIYNRY